MSIPENASIECPQQEIEGGYILCGGADLLFGPNATDRVTEQFCYDCTAGRIFREIGCNQFSAGKSIIEARSTSGRHLLLHSERILCLRKNRETSYEDCEKCTLVSSPETERIYSDTVQYLGNIGFDSARIFLEDARRELIVNNKPEKCITASNSSLESTMKIILEKLGHEPEKMTLTQLWKNVKEELLLGDQTAAPIFESLIGSLTGAISHLGRMRNSLSTAHGKGSITPELFDSYAELAMNISGSLSTFLIRRFMEENGEEIE